MTWRYSINRPSHIYVFFNVASKRYGKHRLQMMRRCGCVRTGACARVRAHGCVRTGAHGPGIIAARGDRRRGAASRRRRASRATPGHCPGRPRAGSPPPRPAAPHTSLLSVLAGAPRVKPHLPAAKHRQIPERGPCLEAPRAQPGPCRGLASVAVCQGRASAARSLLLERAASPSCRGAAGSGGKMAPRAQCRRRQ